MSKIITIAKINEKIYNLRNTQVMLDSDLADLYKVETKVFNQAVKRNIERFPKEFRFQLTENEYENLRSQSVTSSSHGGRRYLPYVFTEQGVAMLSAILKSDIAIEMSIKIINAFVQMRSFIVKHGTLIEKLQQLETKQSAFEVNTNDKFNKLFSALEDDSLSKKQGIFYDGQIFDAYVFISKLIKKAKSSIILIDNYIDESVLELLAKSKKSIRIYILSKNISKQLKLDVQKYNEQYGEIKLIKFKRAHDRFLILDEKQIYHIGASIKDLGKKWFAFSKLETVSFGLMEAIKHELP